MGQKMTLDRDTIFKRPDSYLVLGADSKSPSWHARQISDMLRNRYRVINRTKGSQPEKYTDLRREGTAELWDLLSQVKEFQGKKRQAAKTSAMAWSQFHKEKQRETAGLIAQAAQGVTFEAANKRRSTMAQKAASKRNLVKARAKKKR